MRLTFEVGGEPGSSRAGRDGSGNGKGLPVGAVLSYSIDGCRVRVGVQGESGGVGVRWYCEIFLSYGEAIEENPR